MIKCTYLYTYKTVAPIHPSINPSNVNLTTTIQGETETAGNLAPSWNPCNDVSVVEVKTDILSPHPHPRQNGRHFAADTFKCVFVNGNF